MTQDGFTRSKVSPTRAALKVHGYVALLDATIDKMLEKQEYSENT